MASFWESVKVDGQEMRQYVSVPGGSGPFPAVVVIHHREGIEQFNQDTADRLAERGFAAVVPDLFHRVSADMLAEGKTPRDLLGDPEIVADVNATVDFLRNHPAIDGERLGIVGFCMGGRVVWLAAATNPHFRAAVPYYGGNIMAPWGDATQSPFDLSSQISCPILFHFGEVDENPSQEDMRKLDAELTRLGKAHEFLSYAGADHGFLNPLGARYHKAGAETSWPRTLDFFSKHLGKVAVPST